MLATDAAWTEAQRSIFTIYQIDGFDNTVRRTVSFRDIPRYIDGLGFAEDMILRMKSEGVSIVDPRTRRALLLTAAILHKLACSTVRPKWVA